MTAIKGVVKAGKGVPLSTIVGGISLALRHARTAHRAGWQELTFSILDEDERNEVIRDFQDAPAPNGLTLKFANEQVGQNSGFVSLEASAIYTCESLTLASAHKNSTCLPADFRIDSKADISGATRFLYARIRKSIEMDGIIAFYVMRPMARLFTRVLLNTSVSPNQATLGALACGIAAAIFASLGTPLYAIFAGLLYWFGGVIDCIDGELARLRLQSSKFGEWLDSMVDEFSTLALIVGIGIGLTRDGYGGHWQLVAFVGAPIAAITLGRMYYHLYKHDMTIDTAQFPWFYVDPNAPASSPTSILGKLIEMCGYIVRRDANLTIISIMLIANMRVVALCTMLVAFSLATLLLVAHYLIMATRRS